MGDAVVVVVVEEAVSALRWRTEAMASVCVDLLVAIVRRSVEGVRWDEN